MFGGEYVKGEDDGGYGDVIVVVDGEWEFFFIKEFEIFIEEKWGEEGFYGYGK